VWATTPLGNGVSIEVWSFAIKDGKRDAALPYFYWVFPYAKLRQSGDRVIENGLLANTFEGHGLGNALFSTGLDDRWEFPIATERPYSYARGSTAPQGLRGFYTWHKEATNTISNKTLTSNVATLTTGSAHGFAVGQSAVVTGVDADFNGTYLITAHPFDNNLPVRQSICRCCLDPVSPPVQLFASVVTSQSPTSVGRVRQAPTTCLVRTATTQTFRLTSLSHRLRTLLPK